MKHDSDHGACRSVGVVFAGGTGRRMNMFGRPKQFLDVNGKPVIIHTLEHFEKCAAVDDVVVVCLVDWIEQMCKLVDEYKMSKVRRVVAGGETGQESIYRGLQAVKELLCDADAVVLIHDGVRPLISPQLLRDGVDAVKRYGSAIACSRMMECPALVDGGTIVESFPRERTCVAKAPQGFWLNDILAAHEDARRRGEIDHVDSLSLMKDRKSSLHWIECGRDNIKITELEDLYLMNAYLRAREDKVNLFGGR